MQRPLSLEIYARDDTRACMVEYIRSHFGELLGPHLALLDQPDGLDALAEMLRKGQLGRCRAA